MNRFSERTAYHIRGKPCAVPLCGKASLTALRGVFNLASVFPDPAPNPAVARLYPSRFLTVRMSEKTNVSFVDAPGGGGTKTWNRLFFPPVFPTPLSLFAALLSA